MYLIKVLDSTELTVNIASIYQWEVILDMALVVVDLTVILDKGR